MTNKRGVGLPALGRRDLAVPGSGAPSAFQGFQGRRSIGLSQHRPKDTRPVEAPHREAAAGVGEAVFRAGS